MSTRNLKAMSGVKSVTRKRSSGKNQNKVAKEPEQETNIDYAWAVARQLSANAKQSKPNSNSANNIRLEYPDVVLAANNKKTSNTIKKPKKQNTKSKPTATELKMKNLYTSSNN